MTHSSTRKKVLIITYYWPPMGGGGVQRWLKMTKYLRDFGWEPVILTVQGGEGAVEDDSLSSQIPPDIETHRVKIWEPFSMYKKFTGKAQGEKLSPGVVSSKKATWSQKLSVWIRGNLFIPDARCFWIRPASKFLDRYLQEHPVDAIVSTGPPHSTHMVALNIKNKHRIPWLADFRDPWTNIDFYDKLMLTKWADRKHHILESKVLGSASKVVTVSQSWAEDFQNLAGVKPTVITNGYDPQDFEHAGLVPLDDKFTLTHAGSLNHDRNPTTLWKVLGELVREHAGFEDDLEIKLIGQVDLSAHQVLEEQDLNSNLRSINNLPHHQVVDELMRSRVLLLLLNNTSNIDGIIPGKLYEYLGARRPVLCIGKETGDAARIIHETNSGFVVDFEDHAKLKNIILEFYHAFKAGTLMVNSKHIEKYSRKILAGQIAEELHKISN